MRPGDPSGKLSKAFTFQIVAPKKLYILCANSEQSGLAWYKAVERVINDCTRPAKGKGVTAKAPVRHLDGSKHSKSTTTLPIRTKEEIEELMNAESIFESTQPLKASK